MARDWLLRGRAEGDGGVVVVGFTTGALPGHTGAGGKDVVAFALAGDGTVKWSYQVGSADNDVATGVAADGAGNLYISAKFSGDLLGAAGQGGQDAAVLKLTTMGDEVWARIHGSSEEDEANGIAWGNDVGVYVAGSSLGEFEGLTRVGNRDVAVVSLCDD